MSTSSKQAATALFFLVTLFFLTQSNIAHSAGLLIADGGLGGVLKIQTQDVDVRINNGVAVTTVDQVFKNTEQRQVEALYTFPVPKGASVSNFSMWINGKEMVGEVLEKQRAREIYNSYKRVRRDPGLLEQVDYKTFEMRIFPINAGAEQRVQITYYQELEFDHDQALYVYPLATVTRKSIDQQTTGRFSINVDINSAIPLNGVESPSHASRFVFAEHGPGYTRASLESTKGSLAKDVVLRYGLSRPITGIDLITSNTEDEDGYFLMTLTIGEELELSNRGMDYIFVLDISGSMANERKLITSKASLGAFIDQLAEEDRFEVMTFNIQPDTLFQQLNPGSPEMKEQARSYLDSKTANGGTNLAPAMTTAYKYGDPDRTLNVIVLSDGMTEQQERAELMRLIQQRPANVRVFTIGIGNEVNRALLEQVAEDAGGMAAFVSRGDDFERQARSFRRRLAHPAAQDLEISFDGVKVYDVEPQQLPNLYHGTPLRIYGRYSGEGEAQVILNANVLGSELRQTVSLDFPKLDEGNPEIERMWALKRVDQLLKVADRSGNRQPVLDEIVRLGEGYSIGIQVLLQKRGKLMLMVVIKPLDQLNDVVTQLPLQGNHARHHIAYRLPVVFVFKALLAHPDNDPIVVDNTTVHDRLFTKEATHRIGILMDLSHRGHQVQQGISLDDVALAGFHLLRDNIPEKGARIFFQCTQWQGTKTIPQYLLLEKYFYDVIFY